MNSDYLLFTVFSFLTFAGWTAVVAASVWYEIRLLREQCEEEQLRLHDLWDKVQRETQHKG
jgi:hypothetical protein